MATVLPRTVTDWLARSPVQLSGWVLARRLPARPARNVIRLPMQRSARFQGAYIRLWISRERLLSGDKNLSSRMHEWPVAEAWKGGTRSCTGCYGFLGCFVYLEVKNLGNQLGLHPAYLFFIEAKVRNTVFVIQGSGCQSRNITLIIAGFFTPNLPAKAVELMSNGFLLGWCQLQELFTSSHAPRGRLSSPFASIPNGRCGFGKVFGNIFEIFQKYYLAGGF